MTDCSCQTVVPVLFFLFVLVNFKCDSYGFHLWLKQISLCVLLMYFQRSYASVKHWKSKALYTSGINIPTVLRDE